MGNKNYTKYSENSNNNDKHIVSKELEETVLRAGGEVMRIDQTEETPEVTPEVSEVPEVNKEDNTNVDPEVPEVNEEETVLPDNTEITGVVTGCSKLNVRKKPNKEAEVIRIFNKGDSVVIDLEHSTNDFYKVLTPSGEGYCVKDFININ